MNRLRVLKGRANRAGCSITKIDNKWFVVSNSGCRWVGYLEGPFPKREAIQQAARFALPSSVKVTIKVS